jgi:hypothetical protein
MSTTETQSFTTTTTAQVSGYTVIGCVPDSQDRLLDAAYYIDQDGQSAELCAQACNGISIYRFYPWFGVENGKECFCGDKPTRDFTKGNNTDGCKSVCSGNNGGEYCGGSGYILLYSALPGFTPSGITPRSTMSTASATNSPSTITGAATSGSPQSTGSSSPAPTPVSSSGSHAGVIAASVLAGLFGLGLVCLAALWLLRRRHSQHERVPMEAPVFQDETSAKHTSDVPQQSGYQPEQYPLSNVPAQLHSDSYSPPRHELGVQTPYPSNQR